MLTKPVYLEIDKPNYVPIYTVQYDYNSRFYEITILNNSQPLDLTGIRVIVAGKKPDGKEVFNSCKVLDAKKGLIQLELTEQMNAVNGASEYALELFSADGMLSSQPFKLIVTRSTISKSVESSKELGALKDALNEVQDIDNRFAQTNAQLSELANKGTTVEVLERVTKEEVERQIADGTMANLTLADNSVSTQKIKSHAITQDKIHPDVKLGVQISDTTTSDTETWSSSKINSLSLKVRDLQKGESVVNISLITGDKYQEALFDFNSLTSDSTRVTDVNGANKFFSLEKVEPHESGAYAKGYNGEMVSNTEAYAVALIFRGDAVNRTGIFRFNGDGNTGINWEGTGIAFTHAGYYGRIHDVPLDADTYVFLLVGIDHANDTLNVWMNNENKQTFSLGGRKIGNIGYLNKGYWSDGNFIYDKIALLNKANFSERELKAIKEHLFTTRYLNVNTSNSYLNIKNGLVRHLLVKNNKLVDVVYPKNAPTVTSVSTDGFVLSERQQVGTAYCPKNGTIFLKFRRTSGTDNKYLYNYSNTEYLWVNFSNNKICSRNGSVWVISERSVTFEDTNVLAINTSGKAYLNGVDIGSCNFNSNIYNFYSNFKNEHKLDEYVLYVESLTEEDIANVSRQMLSK